MDKVTACAIAFVPAIVLFPLYVWFLATHKPKRIYEKTMIKAKQTGSTVTGHLVKEKTRRQYMSEGSDSYQRFVGYRTNGFYKYTVDGHTYKYAQSEDGESVAREITLYYDCDHPKHAYTEGYVNYTKDRGCLLGFLEVLPLLEPWIVLVALIKIFNIS